MHESHPHSMRKTSAKVSLPKPKDVALDSLEASTFTKMRLHYLPVQGNYVQPFFVKCASSAGRSRRHYVRVRQVSFVGRL